MGASKVLVALPPAPASHTRPWHPCAMKLVGAYHCDDILLDSVIRRVRRVPGHHDALVCTKRLLRSARHAPKKGGGVARTELAHGGVAVVAAGRENDRTLLPHRLVGAGLAASPRDLRVRTRAIVCAQASPSNACREATRGNPRRLHIVASLPAVASPPFSMKPSVRPRR